MKNQEEIDRLKKELDETSRRVTELREAIRQAVIGGMDHKVGDIVYIKATIINTMPGLQYPYEIQVDILPSSRYVAENDVLTAEDIALLYSESADVVLDGHDTHDDIDIPPEPVRKRVPRKKGQQTRMALKSRMPFSDKENEYLKNNSDLSVDEMSIALSRSYQVISKQLRNLGIYSYHKDAKRSK